MTESKQQQIRKHDHMVHASVRVALLYGDYSGLDDRDCAAVERFQALAIQKWGSGFWYVESLDDDSDQGPCDATGWWGRCVPVSWVERSSVEPLPRPSK